MRIAPYRAGNARPSAHCHVLVPAAAVLERIGLATCVRARKRAFQALADGLTGAEREGLDALLAVDPELRRSRFAWLRDYSEVAGTPSNIIHFVNAWISLSRSAP